MKQEVDSGDFFYHSVGVREEQDGPRRAAFTVNVLRWSRLRGAAVWFPPLPISGSLWELV